MSDPVAYYVQCISGDPNHIKEVIPGTPLKAQCKERANRGLLDALCLSTDECPECIYEKKERDRRFANICADDGCAFMDDRCKTGYLALCDANFTQQSAYDGQLRGLALT